MQTWLTDLFEIGKQKRMQDYIGQIYESLIKQEDQSKIVPGYIAVCFDNALKNEYKRTNRLVRSEVFPDIEDASELSLASIESKITDPTDLKMLDDYFECGTWYKLADKWGCTDKTAKSRLIGMLRKYLA